MLCDSGTFLKFWLDDRCRDAFLSYLPQRDLASLRLACHDFSVRAAPTLFQNLSITFRTNTFTKPARLAALSRLGFYVKTLDFQVSHSPETFLPPLVHPESGEELSFTYTPQLQTPSARRPKYGDIGTTEVLTRQYPALFHAATNVPAFVRAFSSFINLKHLRVSCPGYDVAKKFRRSIVDFTLISLRIAVEQNCLNALDELTLAPIHPGGLLYLSPSIGYGATPKSASKWSRVKHLTIYSDSPPTPADGRREPDHFKLLQTYLRNFQSNLKTLSFRWNGDKGPLPVQRPVMSGSMSADHPAHRRHGAPIERPVHHNRSLHSLHFPKLRHFEVENVACAASDISLFVASHRLTLEEVNFEDVRLTFGSWDDALAPLAKHVRSAACQEAADIPIMLSPRAAASSLPAAMERVEVPNGSDGRWSLRPSRWLSHHRRSRPVAIKKVREGLLGCDGQLRKVLGGVLPWT